MRKNLLFVLSLSSFATVLAQQKPADTLAKSIDEVVITGQFGNRSIKKSLYKVEVIDRAQIERFGANNVADVLNQTLNILIIPEKNTGDSKANIMGLGANYTKILVDNIPLVGDEGLGSNLDLTKLNLDNVERIEIVKGSMGVEYGSNAMAGVINIITKKGQTKKWSVRGFVQEETIGKEYDWVDYGKGRHIQSLQIGHNINSKLFAQIGVNRNDFQGYWSGMKGKNHFERDGKRGYEWQPKEQINPNLLLRFSAKDLQLMYKSDYMNEVLNVYSPTVIAERVDGGRWTYIARDRDYNTQRWLHHLALNANIFNGAKLSIDASYQAQKRMYTPKVFDIPQRKVYKEEPTEVFYSAETLFSRGRLSNFLPSKKWDAELGYEVDYTQGFAGASAGRFADGSGVQKSVFSGGAFMSAEFHLVDDWFVRPGIRYNFSSVFQSKPNFSLVMKNTLNNRSEFRAVIGSSNRNPTFEELYTLFKDMNHDVQGNTHLIPESSYSGSLFYTYSSPRENAFHWSVDANSMYLMVRNQIRLAVTEYRPMLKYQYVNLSQFESWINSLSFRFRYQTLSMNFGASILGRAHQIDKSITHPKYHYTPELSIGISWEIPKTKTVFSFMYKGVGESYDIEQDRSLGISEMILVRRRSFNLLDASISQKFWKDKLGLTVGTKNLTDITMVPRDMPAGGGAHGSTGNNTLLFYGRSYFARLNFNF